MIVTRLDDKLPMYESAMRTEGVHVSEIIRTIMCELDEKYKREITDDDRMRMECGFMFEHVLGAKLGERPGEIVVDGIIGSPDGISKTDEGIVVEEAKFTWKSSNKPVEDDLWWLMQTKAYCYMMETNRCNLHVMYINGDYKHPYVPKYQKYRIEYSRQELQENWMVLTNHAKAKGMTR